MKKGIEKIIMTGAFIGALGLGGCTTYVGSAVDQFSLTPQERALKSEAQTRHYEVLCLKQNNGTTYKNTQTAFNNGISKCAGLEKKKSHLLF